MRLVQDPNGNLIIRDPQPPKAVTPPDPELRCPVCSYPMRWPAAQCGFCSAEQAERAVAA